ncbi:MAG: M42 family metallopeptidase [Rhodothermaceae bacterium]|nr:M42 family metallopeptidase [Rhodothermaceae bacterium]
MTDAARAFLFDLLRTPSPTGFETPGQRVWAQYVQPHADRVESDAYGNIWATLNGADAEGPRLMLEAHADEIGLMVKYVTDEGFIHVDRIGGTDHAIARGKRVTILGSEGPVLGVVGNTAIHLRDRSGEEKAPKLEELFVDIGAASKDEVAERGVRVGHPAIYAEAVEQLTEKRLIGRALDNRLGGFVIAQVLKNLAGGDRPVATVHAVNAVQEEIGGNGARMVAYRLEPTLALVLDVTHATDSPGIEKAKHGAVTLGGGPSVTHGTVNHPRMVERLIEVAEAEDIPLQHEASSRFSGTDTDVIFTTKRGVPSALVSVPMRYMHSTVETVDLDDVERTIRLMTAFARSVRADDTFAAQVL